MRLGSWIFHFISLKFKCKQPPGTRAPALDSTARGTGRKYRLICSSLNLDLSDELWAVWELFSSCEKNSHFFSTLPGAKEGVCDHYPQEDAICLGHPPVPAEGPRLVKAELPAARLPVKEPSTTQQKQAGKPHSATDESCWGVSSLHQNNPQPKPGANSTPN